MAGADSGDEAVRRSFDRIAEQYAADFADELERKPFDRERLRRFAAACQTGPVLDVGCGAAGHVERFVADSIPQGLHVTGVDLSERSVALARRLNPARAFVAADMRALPLRPVACGGIVAFYSLIYGDDGHVAASLGEFRRVLRPNAPLLVAAHAGRARSTTTSIVGSRWTSRCACAGRRRSPHRCGPRDSGSRRSRSVHRTSWSTRPSASTSRRAPSS